MSPQLISLNLHPGQKEVYNAFWLEKMLLIQLRCGRRWGKTELCARIAAEYAIRFPGSLIWWVAPYYGLTRIGYRKFDKFFRDRKLHNTYIRHARQEPLHFEMTNGTFLYMKSAENPDQLIGEGVDLLICDEAARYSPTVWNENLQPTLFDNPDSRAIIISTPRGHNWFWELNNFIDAGDIPRSRSFHYTSWDNPFISKARIQRMADDPGAPEEAKRQEIYAEYIDDALSAFAGWRACLGGQRRPAIGGHTHSIGVDLGRKKDFTVISVIDRQTNEQVYFDRFADPQWTVQSARIAGVVKHYPGSIIIETTGIGDPVVQHFHETYGVKVESWQQTSRSKDQLIRHGQILLAEKSVKLLNETQQSKELDAFELKFTTKGTMTAGAPHGQHDDCVIALLLSLWGLAGLSVVIPTNVRTSGQRREAYQIAGGVF